MMIVHYRSDGEIRQKSSIYSHNLLFGYHESHNASSDPMFSLYCGKYLSSPVPLLAILRELLRSHSVRMLIGHLEFLWSGVAQTLVHINQIRYPLE